MVANLIEWATIFWPVFAINVAVSGTEGGHHINAGFVYVCARLLYVVLGLTIVIPSRYHAAHMAGHTLNTPSASNAARHTTSCYASLHHTADK